MPINELLTTKSDFQLDTVRKPPGFIANHVSFAGTPEKHPYDDKKIILIVDPLSTNISYYEFYAADIDGAEELPSLVTMEGESVRVIRVWVKKGSIGVRSVPFVVEDTVKG